MPNGYQCGVCSSTIEDSRKAVFLTAEWLPDWEANAPDPSSQSFWLHSDCLKKIWTGSYPWEEHILYGEENDG